MPYFLFYLLFFAAVGVQVNSKQCLTEEEPKTAVNKWLEDKSTAELSYGPIADWPFCGGTSFQGLFNGKGYYGVNAKARAFNEDISGWDTSGVTDMQMMFNGANAFNQDLSQWDTSKVTNMSGMFAYATSFNQDLSNWDTSKVTNMSYMFDNATSFGVCLAWDISYVQYTSNMFTGLNGGICAAESTLAPSPTFPNGPTTRPTSRFPCLDTYGLNAIMASDQWPGNMSQAENKYGPISNWRFCIENSISFHYLFKGALSFNKDLSNWDTAGVTRMSQMFYNAFAFNRNISEWDTSDVTNMARMFYSTGSFNGDISGWDTAGVTDMRAMFFRASAFNQDLSKWDILGVTDMGTMFHQATSFGICLNWDISNVQDTTEMFFQSKGGICGAKPLPKPTVAPSAKPSRNRQMTLSAPPTDQQTHSPSKHPVSVPSTTSEAASDSTLADSSLQASPVVVFAVGLAAAVLLLSLLLYGHHKIYIQPSKESGEASGAGRDDSNRHLDAHDSARISTRNATRDSDRGSGTWSAHGSARGLGTWSAHSSARNSGTWSNLEATEVPDDLAHNSGTSASLEIAEARFDPH